MTEYVHHKTTPSVALVIGVLLTLVAVLGHRYLPERRLTISSERDGANFFLVQTGYGSPAELHWIDQEKFHYACKFSPATTLQGCGFAFMLATEVASNGIDLSRFERLNLAIRYQGTAQYLRVGIRNFDSRFSRVEDLNSPKFNFVNLPVRDLATPIEISLREFAVAEWWTTAYNLPREYSRPDIGNATVLNIDLQGELTGTQHDIQIDKLEFVGAWISAESWYFAILCLWMFLGAVYGVSQWLRLRRAHRDQRKRIKNLEDEKQKYQELSILDALTSVLNRHGIEKFIAALDGNLVPVSIIVIDLDHFKRINDERGHHIGDQVLRTLGEVLRTNMRSSDAVGRWGGEEFVVVCPGTNLVNAADIAENLREKIMDTNFIADDPIPITASLGVATSSEGQHFDEVFKNADEALYLAKSRGRNCVIAADGDEMRKVTGAGKGTMALISGRFKLRG
jgi:diguanylate cyclase (GGDEF)-like protein